MISSTLSLSIMVSLSRIISLRSIETTSPVSSSTNLHAMYSIHAAFLPIYFLSPVLETLISSARSKISRISLSLSKTLHEIVVTGNFFLSVDISVHYTINICRKFYPRTFKKELLWQNIFCSIY
jgi:hypothetical protein